MEAHVLETLLYVFYTISNRLGLDSRYLRVIHIRFYWYFHVFEDKFAPDRRGQLVKKCFFFLLIRQVPDVRVYSARVRISSRDKFHSADVRFDNNWKFCSFFSSFPLIFFESHSILFSSYFSQIGIRFRFFFLLECVYSVRVVRVRKLELRCGPMTKFVLVNVSKMYPMREHSIKNTFSRWIFSRNENCYDEIHRGRVPLVRRMAKWLIFGFGEFS